MESWKKTLLVTAVLLLVPAAAFANNGWLVDVRGGMAFPMWDYGDSFKPGILTSGELSRMLGSRFAVGVGVSYAKNGITDSYQANLDAIAPGGDAESQITHYGAHVKYLFSAKESGIQPYFVGGLGFYNEWREVNHPVGHSQSGHTHFGIRAGMGANLLLGRSTGLGFQADLNDITQEREDTLYLGLSAGLHWHPGLAE